MILQLFWLWKHIPLQQLGYASLEVSGQSIEKILGQIKLTEMMILRNCYKHFLRSRYFDL
jgi:hypothetical protein